jgi:hypothetical protein
MRTTAQDPLPRKVVAMKSLAAFILSLIAVPSDGDAGAVLLREH